MELRTCGSPILPEFIQKRGRQHFRRCLLGKADPLMSEYVIITDSACDLPGELLKERWIGCVEILLSFEKDHVPFKNSDIDIKDFYDRMREGEVARTSAANFEDFSRAFRSVLDAGKDILYLAFSSGLSSTCEAAKLAAGELMKEYEGRRILVLDTLCASGGQGLFVYLVSQKRDEGVTLDELYRYGQDLVLKLCHWFTVDDLVYLKRGGRVSTAAAFAAGILDIRPVMHVDNEGHLINVMKVRGRKRSIQQMFRKYEETALDKEHGTVFICNADCIGDAEYLAGLIREKYGNEVKLITDIGPVIGAHSGPGTLALFFVGEKR